MKKNMILVILLCGMVLSCVITGTVSEAQVGVFSKGELIEYTHLWKGERFTDGRPKVSDEILERMKDVVIEEAWSVLRRHGYNDQFEGNWVLTEDNPSLVGRAVTAFYYPLRPDVNDVIMEKGKRDGRIGAQNSWIIDTLVDGDVIVVDIMGKVINGTFLFLVSFVVIR